MTNNRTRANGRKSKVHDFSRFDPNGPRSHEDALARLKRGEIVKACHLPPAHVVRPACVHWWRRGRLVIIETEGPQRER